MPNDRKYGIYYCSSDKTNFMVLPTSGTPYCPSCGDNIDVRFVEFRRALTLGKLSRNWTQAELDTIKYAREKKKMKWKDFSSLLPYRTWQACKSAYYNKIKDKPN